MFFPSCEINKQGYWTVQENKSNPNTFLKAFLWQYYFMTVLYDNILINIIVNTN